MGRAVKRKIDLDARRKSRAAAAEVDQEPVEIKFCNMKFTLPAEMPWRFASLAFAGDVDGALRLAFDAGEPPPDEDDPQDSQYDRFLWLNPSVTDVLALVEDIGEAYGLSMGESSASASSS